MARTIAIFSARIEFIAIVKPKNTAMLNHNFHKPSLLNFNKNITSAVAIIIPNVSQINENSCSTSGGSRFKGSVE